MPLFRHCTLFPHVTTFDQPENHVVEVSRVSISRDYARRRGDPPFDAAVGSSDRRRRGGRRARANAVQHRAQPFITLVKAIITGCKSMGADTFHWRDRRGAANRWLVHYGLPYRISRSRGRLLRPVIAPLHPEPGRARPGGAQPASLPCSTTFRVGMDPGPHGPHRAYR